MPRYFFHVEDGAGHVDKEGVELAGLEAARQHAVCYFGELLCDAARDFWTRDAWLMRVTDETGLIYFTLHFTATIAAAGGGAVRRN